MIPKKYTPYVFSFFMALFMSMFMSFVITVMNIGWVDNIVFIWLKAWGLSFLIAFPTAMFVSPLIAKIVSFVVK
ncbi:DUF2798 domain-containing protein [Vibrio sp.]|nr:DUF2798 domain-containing protein [Vibrio sp.]